MRTSVLALAALAAVLGGCARSGSWLPAAAPNAAPVPGRVAGRTDALRRVAVSVTLPSRDEAGLERLVRELGDPSSPHFRHFLTPAQYDARFAPTRAQYARVAALLRAAGFRIERTYATRELLEASAPAQTVERTFATRLLDVEQDGAARQVNADPVTIPAQLAPLIANVDVASVVYASAAAFARPNPGTAAPPKPAPAPKPTRTPPPVGPGSGQPLSGPTFASDGGWAPFAVARGFDFPVQHGYNGRGTAIAIVMQNAILQPDLEQFLTANKIVRRGRIREIPVGTGAMNGDPTVGMLDVETVAALAPGADVLAYETPDLANSTVLGAYHTILADAKADVVESTFGECETADPAFNGDAEHAALHGAALGMTFVASSGNTGSACFNGNRNIYGALTPAAAPAFVAVGGNESVSPSFTPAPCACPIQRNEAWSDHDFTWGGLSGGGVSNRWRLPKYQDHVRGSPASSIKRNVPDIAYPAVDVDLRLHDTNEVIDGTAWGTSIAAALFAQSVQICGKLGDPHQALYAAFANHQRQLFYDVISGFNGRYVGGLPRGYDAVKGYDNVTGLGMPRGFRLAAALCGRGIK